MADRRRVKVVMVDRDRLYNLIPELQKRVDQEGVMALSLRLRVTPLHLKMLSRLGESPRTANLLRRLAQELGIEEGRFATVSYRQV